MTTAKTAARIENPYFARVELYSPMDGWDIDETRTLVKAFATKREAWEYVKRMDAQYSREVYDALTGALDIRRVYRDNHEAKHPEGHGEEAFV